MLAPSRAFRRILSASPQEHKRPDFRVPQIRCPRLSRSETVSIPRLQLFVGLF